MQGIRDIYSQHDRRDQVPKLKIIVMSAVVIESVLEECKALEIVYSLKPSNLSELRQILNGDTRERSQNVTTTVQNTTEV